MVGAGEAGCWRGSTRVATHPPPPNPHQWSRVAAVVALSTVAVSVRSQRVGVVVTAANVAGGGSGANAGGGRRSDLDPCPLC
jgi:hypothetical protein